MPGRTGYRLFMDMKWEFNGVFFLPFFFKLVSGL